MEVEVDEERSLYERLSKIEGMTLEEMLAEGRRLGFGVDRIDGDYDTFDEDYYRSEEGY